MLSTTSDLKHIVRRVRHRTRDLVLHTLSPSFLDTQHHHLGLHTHPSVALTPLLVFSYLLSLSLSTSFLLSFFSFFILTPTSNYTHEWLLNSRLTRITSLDSSLLRPAFFLPRTER